MSLRLPHEQAHGVAQASLACRARPLRVGAPHRTRANRRIVASVSTETKTTTTTAAEATPPAASRCPVLSALSPPPAASIPWWRALYLQLTDTPRYQEEVLARGPVVATTFAGAPAVMTSGGEDARRVLQGEGEGLTTVGYPPSFVTLLGSRSMFNVTGPDHRFLRDLMHPLLSLDAVAGYVPLIVTTAEATLADWAARSGGGGAAGGAPLLATEELKLFAFQIIIQVVYGRALPRDQLETLNRLFLEIVGGLFALPYIDLPFTQYGKAIGARKKLRSMLQEAIDEARAEAATGVAPRGLLGAMLAAADGEGRRLSDDDIADNVVLMLFAGHDTSAATLTLVLYYLARSPATLAKLRAEQAAVCARHGERLGWAALREMEYMEAVLRETLRLSNIIPGVVRTAAKDFELGGHRIDGGSMLVVPLSYLATHDPRFEGVDDAAEFKPERMLLPEAQKQGWLMPFGLGNRACVGKALAMAEMKTFLAVFARGYAFTADTNTTFTSIPMTGLKNKLPISVFPLPPGGQ